MDSKTIDTERDWFDGDHSGKLGISTDLSHERKKNVIDKLPQSRTSLSLIARIVADEQLAWEELVRLYGPLVVNWGKRAGLQSADVADLTQEVFGVISRRIHTFNPAHQPTGAFRSWLWGITRLLLLDFQRSDGKHAKAVGGSDMHRKLEQIPTEVGMKNVADDGASSRVLIESALEILSRDFGAKACEAFWRLGVLGEPARKIGEELEMTPKAVRQAKYRATQRLRELLKNEFPQLAQG